MGQLTAMAEAFGVAAAAMYEDRVTFNRSTITKGTSGGNITGAPVAVASNIPCRYRPASGREIELAGKTLGGTGYMVCVPATFGGSLVEVDSKCKAVIAARNGGEVSRTFNVVAPLRKAGIEIECLVEIES